MHDIQSEGHTWLLCHKNTSSSNSRWLIVVSLGDKKTLPMPFQVLSAPPDIGAAFHGAAGRSALCVRGAETPAVFKAPVGENGVAFLGFFSSINHILDT